METLRREWRLGFSNKQDLLTPWIFFIMVVTLFPLAVTPEKEFLAKIAPGVIWVAALLATLLSLDRLFKRDFEDGSLEQLLISPHSLILPVLAKVVCHWLLTGLPLALISPLLALMLFLPSSSIWALFASLLLGTPILSLIGAIGAGLTVGLRHGSVLLSLLVLPLYIPVLIFGSGAVKAAVLALPFSGHLALLTAMMLIAWLLAPWSIAAGLRISVSQ